MQFTSIVENNFSRGEAAHTSENLIPEGYVETLVNGDVVERRLRKRAGYQGYSGSLPLRVEEVRYPDSNTITYVLSASIDILNQPSSPLVVYGRGSLTGSTTDSGHYYPGYTVNILKTLATGTSTLSLPGSDHGFTGTNQLMIGVAHTYNIGTLDYERIYADTTSVNKTTADVDITYTNYTGSTLNAVVFYADIQPVTGQVYVQTGSAVAGTPVNVTISAATHGFSTADMLVRVYEDTGTHYREIKVDQVVIGTGGAGNVNITFTPDVALNYRITLISTPVGNVAEGTVGSGLTGSYTIANPDTPFQFIECYLEDPVTEIRQRIEPDQISYSSTTKDITVNFTNQGYRSEETSSRSPDGLNYVICWTSGRVISNTVTVSRSHGITPGLVDSDPQFTIWGFYHSEIYSTTASERAGWVNHIDSYRREAEQRLVAGLGGNLFSSRLASELSAGGTDYKLGSLATRLRGRVSATTVIGPAIYATNTSAGRTRGYLTIDGGAYNRAEVIGAEYVTASTSEVIYTLAMPGLTIRNSENTSQALTTANLAQVIQAGTDFLTISGMTYARLNGEFSIQGVTYVGPSLLFGHLIEIRVRNPNIDSADWNDPAPRARGIGGIYTDTLTFSSTSPFLPGDIVESSVFPADTYSLQCVSTSGNTVVIRNLVDKFAASSGLRVIGRRTSSVIPLWDLTTNLSSTSGIVRGDSLYYSGLDRILQAVHVNAEADRTISSISGDGSIARVTLSAAATNLSVGQSVILREAGPFTGVVVISSISSPTEFDFASTVSGTEGSAVLVGYTVEVDEVLDWSDSSTIPNLLTVERRWIPIESPESAGPLIPNTRTYHFDNNYYDNQPYLRSTLSRSNMYLTNGVDSVQVFDGSNLRQTGLPNWQAPIFAQTDTTAPVITVTPHTVDYSVDTGGVDTLNKRVEIDKHEAEANYPVGTRIQITNGVNIYRGYVDKVIDAPSTGRSYVRYKLDGNVDPIITHSATPRTLAVITVYRYFAQLQSIDANINIAASAALGSANLTVELLQSSGVELTFIAPPDLGNYDYRTLELRIFRTLSNNVAPYYNVTTLPLRDYYKPGNPYITFRDTFSDSSLGDPYNLSKITGIELPTQLRQAPLAKYITSYNNSVVLANTTDQPLLDIRWETVNIGGKIAISDLTGTLVSFRRDDTLTGAITAESTLEHTAVYELCGATTPVTLTYNSHTSSTLVLNCSVAATLAPGNWIYLTTIVSGNNINPIRGWWQIISANATTITIGYSGGNPGAGLPTHIVTSPTNKNRVPVYIGTDDFNSDTMNWNSTISTRVLMTWRLASAINVSMRIRDFGYPDSAWLSANAGGEYSTGQIIVRHLQTDADTPEVEISCPAGRLGSVYNIFINSIDARSGTSNNTSQISSTRTPGGSRLYISYPNFPEIFSNNNYIDVNADDGQEITGVISFFGDSISSGSQNEGSLLVFKSNSVYAVTINFASDPSTGYVLTYNVTKLDTNGLGCTAPYSIAVTKGGIMFANETGIYRITRSNTMEYIGYFEEKNWLQTVNRNRLDLAQGHHYGIGQKYKLSVPASDENANSLVFTYSHTQESAESIGAWSRYDNHPSTGWANLGTDAYFASTLGRVFVIRRAGDRSDFRDDASPISFQVILRATDFGDSGIRKVIGGITTHFRMPVDPTQPMDGTILSTAADFLDQYTQTTPVKLPRDITPNNLNDPARQRIAFVQSSIKYRRITYIQVSYTNSGYDEDVEITGVTYRVSALSGRGILEAQQVTTRK